VRLLVPRRNGLDVAVFDGTSGRARLAPLEFSRGNPEPDVLGFAPDGALWLLEDARRIVRLSPRLLEREVLFPRER
jgi:streptogramin lyase